MEDLQSIYDADISIRSEEIYRFYFTSKGKKDIRKVVEYSLITDFNKIPVFNLGFGDYDKENDGVLDEELSSNGDQYKVFHTVLNTIPKLFHTCGNVILHVKGSDSTLKFIAKCKASCSKNCGDECKKAHRRMNIYRSFLNKHFYTLRNMGFYFVGLNSDVLEPYQIGKKYRSVVVMKLNLN
jgi:hypothetical protein